MTLRRLALPGIAVLLAAGGCAVVPAGTQPAADGTVTLGSGEAVTGDLVVGCDGVSSAVRASGDFGARVRSTGQVYLRGLRGRYVYADLCEGQLRSLVPHLKRASDDRKLGLRVASPSSFGEDQRHRLYVTSLEGPVYRLVAR